MNIIKHHPFLADNPPSPSYAKITRIFSRKKAELLVHFSCTSCTVSFAKKNIVRPDNILIHSGTPLPGIGSIYCFTASSFPAALLTQTSYCLSEGAPTIMISHVFPTFLFTANFGNRIFFPAGPSPNLGKEFWQTHCPIPRYPPPGTLTFGIHGIQITAKS